MSSFKPPGRKRATKRVRFVDQDKLVKKDVNSRNLRSISSEYALNHTPKCPLAKKETYKKTYHIQGRKTSSMDKLILYYLTRLKRLYSEDEWQKALGNSKESSDIESQHSNTESYCSHRYNHKLNRTSSKLVGNFEQKRKRSTIEELIAQSLRYGVRKGILEKDGNCYKWKKPYSSSSTLIIKPTNRSSCSDLCVAHIEPARKSCLRSQSAKCITKLPHASHDSFKLRSSTIHKNPLKHISSSSLRTTSSSTLSDAPLPKKAMQKASKNIKRVEPRSATDSENYCTSQETLTDYKPLRNHQCKSPTFYFRKKKKQSRKTPLYDQYKGNKKNSYPVSNKPSKMDVKDCSKDDLNIFGVGRKRALRSTNSSTTARKKKKFTLSKASVNEASERIGDSESNIIHHGGKIRKGILKKKKNRRKRSLKKLI